MQQRKVLAWMLCEEASTPSNLQIIGNSKDCVKIQADLQDTSEWNRNRRKYPTLVVKRGLESTRIRELINVGGWVGEAGHPINPTIERQTNIVESNVSHRVLSYRFEGPIVKGIVKTAPTPMGYAMRNFILDEDAMKVSFSLRAVGPVSATPEGHIVKDPLTIICYDWVKFPSHPGAYQTAILENVAATGNSLTESCAIALLESQAIDFVKAESKNFRIVSELLEASGVNGIQLANNNKTIILSEGTAESNQKIAVNIESFISNEINHHMSNLFR